MCFIPVTRRAVTTTSATTATLPSSWKRPGWAKSRRILISRPTPTPARPLHRAHGATNRGFLPLVTPVHRRSLSALPARLCSRLSIRKLLQHKRPSAAHLAHGNATTRYPFHYSFARKAYGRCSNARLCPKYRQSKKIRFMAYTRSVPRANRFVLRPAEQHLERLQLYHAGLHWHAAAGTRVRHLESSGLTIDAQRGRLFFVAE